MKTCGLGCSVHELSCSDDVWVISSGHGKELVVAFAVCLIGEPGFVCDSCKPSKLLEGVNTNFVGWVFLFCENLF